MRKTKLSQYNLLTTETAGFNADRTALQIIDQTLLPNEIVILEINELQEIWQAINILQVRGAPAIGVAAAIGLAVIANRIKAADLADFKLQFNRAKAYLATARPTAVNLFWALEQMADAVSTYRGTDIAEIKKILLEKAESIKNADITTCRAIGENGFPLIKDCRGILTHCNAGQLATVKYGTALAPIYIAKKKGIVIPVFSDETRPLLQGARLTAFELTSAGIPTTAICDNMAATVMAQGKVDAVIVGADRIAANGDTANKIGTLGTAVLAKEFNIPFYIAAPTNTIDFQTPNGDSIIIEERSPLEVKELWYRRPLIPEKAEIYNPAFDVTPARYITAFITEKGVFQPEALMQIQKQ
ncbi:MAG: S-methyl-5-thioribose-1-phosphate isomerase [Bacillota bacterium]|jgi:methylthioribose-1-phosphate isomerase